MTTIMLKWAIVILVASAAAAPGADSRLAALAHPGRRGSRPGAARTYTNEDLRRAAGRMTFSRPALSASEPSPPVPATLRPATRRARSARSAQPASGPSRPAPLPPRTDRPVDSSQEQPAFISDQPWGTPFKNSIQRQQEKFDRAASQSSRQPRKAVPRTAFRPATGSSRR